MYIYVLMNSTSVVLGCRILPVHAHRLITTTQLQAIHLLHTSVGHRYHTLPTLYTLREYGADGISKKR